MIGKGWRLTAAVVAFAVAVGLLSACGQHQPEESEAAAVSENGQSATTAADGQETSLTRNGSEASTDMSPAHTDAASTVAPDQPTTSASSPSGQPDSGSTVSPDPSTSSSASGAASVGSTGQSTSSTSPSSSGRTDSATAASSNQLISPSSPSGSSAPVSAVPPTASAPASSAKADKPEQPQKSEAVTFSVIGNAEWGTVIEPETIAIKSGDTVSDLLIRTLKSHKLAYETRGSGALFYVTGIDGLFEFDDGPTSGWKYRVNGEVVGSSAGNYKLEPGDRVEWFYASDDEEAGSGGNRS